MSPPSATRRRARSRDAKASTSTSSQKTLAPPIAGRLLPLSPSDLDAIHQASIAILSQIGLSEASPTTIATIIAAGGRLDDDQRLIFPEALISRALSGLRRTITLHGQSPGQELILDGARVHVGSGGASPQIAPGKDLPYRAATLADLFDAARLVDRLGNLHFFSRSVVAGDMDTNRALDLNTAFASLAGTTKHVIVSAADPSHVEAIAALCFAVAGSREAFLQRPFLSFNINHVVPPLRFHGESCDVLAAALRLGFPVMVNTFGQLGASSPVTIAGCLAQTNAETLAGMIFAWCINPEACAVYGPRPMITDLRSGGMAGGSGEQALLTAAAIQLANYYDLPSSTIAGASDSKIADAQAGYEKALTITLAAQAGANLITQAAGTLASLTAACFEAYVIDNDMLGAVLQAARPIDVSPETLSVPLIAETIRGAGHFLGNSQTYARMKTDFLYPDLADRRAVDLWEADGSPDIRRRAQARANDILASHYPDHFSAALQDRLRRDFDIRLPRERMRRQ